MTDRTVVRGGYGVFNMALHLDNINTLGTNPPTASVQVTNPTLNPLATIAFPFPAALVPANTIFNVTSAEVDRNHRDGYYQNWNVAVGYELSRAVGRRGAVCRLEGHQPGHQPDQLQQPGSGSQRRRRAAPVAPARTRPSAAFGCG